MRARMSGSGGARPCCRDVRQAEESAALEVRQHRSCARPQQAGSRSASAALPSVQSVQQRFAGGRGAQVGIHSIRLGILPVLQKDGMIVVRFS